MITVFKYFSLDLVRSRRNEACHSGGTIYSARINTFLIKYLFIADRRPATGSRGRGRGRGEDGGGRGGGRGGRGGGYQEDGPDRNGRAGSRGGAARGSGRSGGGGRGLYLGVRWLCV